MLKLIKRAGLITKFIALSCIIVSVTILLEHIYVIKSINSYYYKNESQKLEKIANNLANDPLIRRFLLDTIPHRRKYIQQLAEQIREASDADFVVLMDMHGIRISHPDEHKIGLHVVGSDEQDVFQGKAYHSQATGTLGTSIRYFIPIYNMQQQQQQIGALLVGTTVNKLSFYMSIVQTPILTGLACALFLSIILSILSANSIKKSLLGLEPHQIATLLEEKNAILESIKEGIIAIDSTGKPTLINKQAHKILNTHNRHNPHIKHIIPNTKLLNVVRTGVAEYDIELNIGKLTILTNRIPLIVENKIVGAIATFRDMTEIKRFAEYITDINKYIDALRSQSHEYRNELHVIYGLIYGNKIDEALKYLNNIIGNINIEKKEINNKMQDPMLAAFLNSKFSRARELDIKLIFNIKTIIPNMLDEDIAKNLISIIGNLIDNAMDAVQQQINKIINVEFNIEDDIFILTVTDNGGGIPQNIIDKVFERGFSTKGKNRGFGLYLIMNIIERLNGEISINSMPNGTQIRVFLPLENISIKYGE